MPKWETKNYKLSGLAAQYYWSEEEMAAALGISVEDLLAGIKAGRWCYHAHPLATKGGYEFNDQAWNENLERAKQLE